MRSGVRPCATCGIRPEARPGVRLCRHCLEVAAVVLEAIKRQDQRASLDRAYLAEARRELARVLAARLQALQRGGQEAGPPVR